MSKRKRGSKAHGTRSTPSLPASQASAAESALPAQPAEPSRRVHWAWVLGLLLLAVAALAIWWLRASAPSGPGAAPIASAASSASTPDAGVASARPTYVDNASCIGCHQDAGNAWRQSHHAMAMAPPTAETVRGDFDDTSFRHQGVTTRFFRRDGRYFVDTEGADGKRADFEVKYTFGVDPLQQYLIATDGGRLQALTIAWDTHRKRWFHLYPDEKAPPGDVMHWSGRYQNANTMCIVCHTTGYEKRYDARTDSFDSHWKEPNVSCQSCHGPGSAHVAWAKNPQHEAAAGHGRYGLSIELRTASSQRAVEVCAACHSRRSELTPAPLAGDPLLDDYLPARITPGLYYADGQQQGEVYAYGSFRQSKMYASGVRCTDCHDAHTGRVKAAGNGVCLQCHAPRADPRFPAAAGDYDTPSHHHHEPGSAGAQCTACHMPSTNYMIVHARPDHSLRVPRPDLDAATGAPDACTQCHKGKPARWAAAAIERWRAPGGARKAPHFGPALAAAAKGEPDADAALARLATDAAQPAIARASALEALRAWPAGHESERIAATRDADPAVRAAAADSIEHWPPQQRVQALAPLLRDPLRAVRTSAARALAGVDRSTFDAATRQAFDAALAEYIAAQQTALDMPGARLNLGVVYQSTGRPELAEENYLAALKLDPDFTPARANLAQFYAARGRLDAAEQVLAEGVARVPAQGELWYSLGLVRAEQGKLAESTAALARAAKLLADRARVHYNLALALQQSGKPRDAEREFEAARRLDPQDAAAPYALAILYAQQQRLRDALAAAEQARQLAPGDPQLDRLVAQLRAQAASQPRAK